MWDISRYNDNLLQYEILQSEDSVLQCNVLSRNAPCCRQKIVTVRTVRTVRILVRTHIDFALSDNVRKLINNASLVKKTTLNKTWAQCITFDDS